MEEESKIKYVRYDTADRPSKADLIRLLATLGRR
jgi:hypothetical protein